MNTGCYSQTGKRNPITSCYVRRDILHPIRKQRNIARGAFHAFRHALGTVLMQAGANACAVQPQLGHADLRMLRYEHVHPQDQRSAVRARRKSFCGVLRRTPKLNP